MGGTGSKYTEKDIRKDWMIIFRSMKFTTSEVLKLFETYNNIDIDKSGLIDVSELLKFLDIKRNQFTERLFAALDKDQSGKLDFYEFVVSLWKFCTLGSSAISVFAFDLYDFDGDGILTFEEMDAMFHDLYWYGNQATEHEAAKKVLADLIKKSPKEQVHIEEFKPFCKTHQALLMPVHMIQEKLRSGCMGVRFWENLSARRVDIRHGLSLPLSELMVLHSDRKRFRELLDDRSSMGLNDMMRTVLINTDSAHCTVTTPENSGHVEKPQSFMNKFMRKKTVNGNANATTTSASKSGMLLPADLLHESTVHTMSTAGSSTATTPHGHSGGRRLSSSSAAHSHSGEHQQHHNSPSHHHTNQSVNHNYTHTYGGIGAGHGVVSPRTPHGNKQVTSPGTSRPGSANPYGQTLTGHASSVHNLGEGGKKGGRHSSSAFSFSTISTQESSASMISNKSLGGRRSSGGHKVHPAQ